MPTLNEQLGSDMKDAMRAKDAAALAVLRSLKSALKYAAIEQLGAEGELGDVAALAVVRKQIKQRQDSLESFTKAGREDLAAKERDEIALLERYLPAPLTPAELAALVDEAIAATGATSRKDMGPVMKLAQERAAGRADGKALSQEVAKRLAP
jgi:uncharacterized protein YqeY